MSASTLSAAQSGTLVINKTVLGGDGSYTFTSPPFSATFTTVRVNTSGGFGYTTITAVRPGSYVFTETFNPQQYLWIALVSWSEAGGAVIAAQRQHAM